jgi:hypothetical protein
MEIDDDVDDAAGWALRRYQEIYAVFEARHPAQLRTNKFVEGLFRASRIREDAMASRADREAARAGDELVISYSQLGDIFAAAPPELREHLFGLLLRTMKAVHELGRHAAPEGRSARDKRSDLAASKGRALGVAIRVYCELHALELKTSENFAANIRPHILELLGLSKKSKSPALRTIVKALHDVQESGARQ